MGPGLSELQKRCPQEILLIWISLAGKLAAAQDNGVEVDQDHWKKMRVQESETPSHETPAEEANQQGNQRIEGYSSWLLKRFKKQILSC